MFEFDAKAIYYPYFHSFHIVDESILDKMLDRCVRKAYKKGDIITQDGQIQRDLLFVKEGVQMSYFDNADKMQVMAFTYAPSLSGIPSSFLFQQPSQYYLYALTDSVFGAISYSDLQQLFEEERGIERLFRKMTEAFLVGVLQRHLELQILTIEERFKQFAQRSPHLFQLVPHKYIANYLGINATNFSKLYNSIKI